MKRRLTVIIFIMLTLQTISAKGIGGYAGSFLRFGTTAYSMAMGGGFTAAIDPGFPGYHNPAAIAFMDKRSGSVLHHFLPLDRYLVSASLSTKLPPTAGLGIGIVNAGVDKIDGRDAAGHKTGTLSTEEYAVYVSFANELLSGLSLGVNVKMFYQILPMEGTVNGKGIGVDAGLLYRQSNNFEMGLVVQDWNAAYAWNTGDVFEEKGSTYQDQFPLQVRAGFAYRPGFIDMIGDYTYFRMGEHVSAHRLRVGGEYTPIERVAVRAGINNFSPTVGLGLNYTLLQRDDAYVDYAFILGRRGEGLTHVFTYVLTF